VHCMTNDNKMNKCFLFFVTLHSKSGLSCLFCGY
jgi:hypothetical protein